jgi:nucleoside-diphosphate-sugar epimerase
MDAAVEIGCECFVNTWSSSEYGYKDSPMSEENLLEPNNLYGISKAAASHYATYIKKSLSFPIVTYRLFSVYWQLEDSKRLIPTLIQGYIWWIVPELSSPYSVRDFIYIDDVIDCYLQADVACCSDIEIVNIWTWVQSSINDVVNTLKNILGSSIDPRYNQAKIYQVEPKIWVADNSKMKSLLQIFPMSLHDWLLRTIDQFNSK